MGTFLNLNMQMDYIMFFYGFAFILMAFITFSFLKRKDETLPWIHLCLFALLHGTYEFLLMSLYLVSDSPVFSVIRIVILYISFLALFEFGRGRVSKWIYVGIIPLSFSGLYFGINEFDVSLRYTLALLGGLAAAYLLFSTAKQQNKGKRALYFTSAAMGIYAICTGIIVPDGNFLFSNFLNISSFLHTFGLPIQFIKGLLATSMAVSLWAYYQRKYTKKYFGYGGDILLLIFFTTIIGGVVTAQVGDQFENSERELLLAKTKIAAAAVNPRRVETLSLSSADLVNPDYQRLKEQMMLIHEANTGCRWFYIIKVINGETYFLADSIEVTSPDYSAPGDKYNNFPKEILKVNQSGEAMTSAPYKDQWGTFVSAFVPIRDIDTGKIIAIMASDMDASLMDMAVQRGKITPILITALLIIILLIIYLNQQRNVESNMKLSEAVEDLQKFKLAVDNVSEHIVITDQDGIILYANKAVSDITGFSNDEIMGSKAGTLWGKLMSLETYRILWETIKDRKLTFTGELTNHRKNGDKYEAFSIISPILDNNRNVKYFVGIERDITKAKEVDRMKTEFVSLVSHQLKSPLGEMKWSMEMLLNGDIGQLTKEQNIYIKNTNQSLTNIIELVNALLDISRLESGKITIQPKLTNMNELVETALTSLEHNSKQKEISIDVVIPTDFPKINIDPKMFGQVVTNLVSNAIKYSPAQSKVKIDISKDNTNMVVKVSDSGYGIPTKEQSKVFTKFYRGENIVQIVSEGSGLGLYLVKQIVEASGGTITFESVEGKGTTFIIKVPLVPIQKREGIVSISSLS